MNTVQQNEQEPPSRQDKVCIGIAVGGDAIRVAARANGRQIACGTFPAGPVGATALLCYLTDWQTPLRLAVAAAGATALGLALAMGATPGREVFLIAKTSSVHPEALARYAERAI